MSKLSDLINSKQTYNVLELLSNPEIKVSAEDLEIALELQYREIIQPLCAALTRDKISISEDFARTAMRKYLLNDFQVMFEIIKTVVASGNKISEILLTESINNIYMKLKFSEILDLFIQAKGKLTAQFLQTAITNFVGIKDIQKICNELIKAKIAVPADFILDAFNRDEASPDLFLQILGTVFLTGGKISEDVLILCFSKYFLAPEIPCILSSIRDSGGILTIKSLRQALDVGLKSEYIKNICHTLIQMNVAVTEEIILDRNQTHLRENILELINVIVATGNQVSEKILILAFNFADTNNIAPFILQAIQKTKGALTMESLEKAIQQTVGQELVEAICSALIERNTKFDNKILNSVFPLVSDTLKRQLIQAYVKSGGKIADLKEPDKYIVSNIEGKNKITSISYKNLFTATSNVNQKEDQPSVTDIKFNCS